MQRLAGVGKGFTTVIGITEAVLHINALIVVRVHQYLAGVHGARVPVAHVGPGFAFIFRAIDTRLTPVVSGRCIVLVALLHADIHDVRVFSVNGNANAPDLARRQTFGQFGPGVSAIGGFVQTTARPVAMKAKGRTSSLIGRRVENARIRGIHRHIHHAGIFIDIQNAVPGFAAVGCFVEPAFFVCAPEAPHRCHVNGVRIRWVRDNPADVMRIVQTHVRPGFTAIGRFINSVAPRGALAIGALARANPHEFRMCLMQRNIADGVRRFVFKNRLKSHTVVGRFPHAARC